METDDRGAEHDRGNEVLSDRQRSNDPGAPDDSGSESVDSGTFWALVDAGIFGDPEDLCNLDFLDHEDDNPSTSGSAQESALTAIRHLQVTEKRRKVLSGRIAISEDDFEEGPQREAFKLLRLRCRNTFLKDVKPDERAKALEWIFTPIEDPVRFEDCCLALDARPHRLQLRLMYEYFRNWVKFPAALPFLSVGLPDEVVPDLLYRAGEDGVVLAAHIWKWPGITIGELAISLDDWSQDRLSRTLHLIDDSGIVQCHIDSWYVTGKRPKQKQVWK